MTVCVFGSINIDITAYLDRLPRPGETLHGHDYKLGLAARAPTRPWRRGSSAPTWPSSAHRCG